MGASIQDSDVLSTLGLALAQAHEWQRAQEVIASIQDSSARSWALKTLGQALTTVNNYEQLLRLVQRSWLQASTRDEAFSLLSLADGLIRLQPEIGTGFYEAFSWVDAFLKG